MRQLFGHPQNIDETIIGKVTKTYSIFKSKSNKIYVGNAFGYLKGHSAIITESNFDGNTPSVSRLQNLNSLYEGDIITISNDGIINVIHEANSRHNAIFITERCNSNCIMCPQPPVNEEPDRYQLNLQHISLLPKNTISIVLTGGEPTLIGNRLFEIIQAIKKHLPKVYINVLSNGIKFENLEYAKEFANTINPRTVVDIPLNSDIDTIHNEIVGSKTFYRTIKGIYNLAKYNVKIGIRIVVHKMNYERLPNLAEYIYSNFPFVYQIAFIQMEPIGNALVNIDKLWIDPVDYNEQLEKALKILYHRDLHVSIYNSQLCILSEPMRQFTVKSISEWKNVYIDVCNECALKLDCPGFFVSSTKFHSKNIKAFKELQACHV